ncbi:MAG: hypothetical protein LBP69_07680 [Treponema sp.]|jgi:hypothetical protein|nr:hypothetical protein [Treponema sp.]
MTKNVIAPNNTENAPRLTEVIARWNFDKAVERLRPKIQRWGTLTVELARELYIAQKYLNGQKGQRKDPEAEDYIRYTWSDFCDAIGMSRQTANSYIRRFLPAELTDNGEDRLLSPEEFKALAAPEAPATTHEQENLIARYNATGERPEGWNRGLEKIVREREQAAKAKEVQEVWAGRFRLDTRRDYFAEIQAIAGKRKRFSLKTPEQVSAQTVMFRTIHEYFGLFDKLPDLLAAAANLTDKVHFVANYFAELLVDDKEED